MADAPEIENVTHVRPEAHRKPGEEAEAVERRLDLDFAAWMSAPSGREPLKYLRITTMTVLPDTATDAQLRYREGARWLLALMEARATRGRNHGGTS